MSIFQPADILIPQNVDFSKWSVVACDQYTSEPEYWEDAERIVGDSSSTLRLIFPEVYLDDDNAAERIERINENMREYLNSGIFRELKNALIYVKRTQQGGAVRHGIVGKIDLEEYDFSKGSQSKIRATEGTIVERIPPRQRVRINAPLELPHILILIDDRENSVVEPLESKIGEFEKLYDFDLMKNAGHITGYSISENVKKQVIDAIDRLSDKGEFEKKYGVSGKGVLMFAAGDGNHSLATAKTCWEEIKKGLSAEEQKTHPARFALVELMNIHDSALEFEPIQRVIFDTDPKALLDALVKKYSASYEDNGGQRIDYVYGEKSGSVYVKNTSSNLPVGTLQSFLDDYLKEHGGRIDYIHGSDVVKNLARQERTIGFLVDAMEKNDLFTTVIKDGSLPRKTFSMGEAADKRFYLECKKIR